MESFTGCEYDLFLAILSRVGVVDLNALVKVQTSKTERISGLTVVSIDHIKYILIYLTVFADDYSTVPVFAAFPAFTLDG